MVPSLRRPPRRETASVHPQSPFFCHILTSSIVAQQNPVEARVEDSSNGRTREMTGNLIRGVLKTANF